MELDTKNISLATDIPVPDKMSKALRWLALAKGRVKNRCVPRIKEEKAKTAARALI